jgi:hypothetical protein
MLRFPFTIHHSPFTIYHSPFTIYHSPFTIHHSPFTIYHLPFSIPPPQFIPHAPPQHPPPLSQLGAADAFVELPLAITAAAGTLISRVCFVELHEGQTMSSATSRVLW